MDQEALSAELERQEQEAERLAQSLANEKSLCGLVEGPGGTSCAATATATSGCSPPSASKKPMDDLERMPTAAVLGQQWADDVHSARAALEAVSRSIEASGVGCTSRYEHACGSSMCRVTGCILAGHWWLCSKLGNGFDQVDQVTACAITLRSKTHIHSDSPVTQTPFC
jgi:hypothetical protein